MNMEDFNYHELWTLQEPVQKPHDIKADELGMVDDIPVSPVLTKLKDSLRRIEELYNVDELVEEGIDVEQLLNQYTEMQVFEYLEENGFECAVTLGEAENLQLVNDWLEIIQLPKEKSDFFLLRQFEESANGKFVDVSAFNTIDFLRGTEEWEFDKYKYFTDKVAERAEDLAIMHSCISNEEGRNNVKQRFESLVNIKFGNYAKRLTEMIRNTYDLGIMTELLEKLHEQNRQIRRLNAIWNKFAYNF